MCECKACGATITEPLYKKKWRDSRYPSVIIGPYCPECYGRMRICSKCREPHFYHDYAQEHGFEDNITIVGGEPYCNSCKDTLEICDHCNNIKAVHKVKNGKRYCFDCYTVNFSTCGCCNEDHLNNSFINGTIDASKYKGMVSKYGKVCRSCFEKEKRRFKEYPVSQCKNCSTIYTLSSEKDNKDYCPDCLQNIKACQSCGKIHHTNRGYPVDTEDNSYVSLCNSCVSKYSKCSLCGRLSINPKKIRGIFKTYNACNKCDTEGAGECSSCLSLKNNLDSNGKCGDCRSSYEQICGDCGGKLNHQGICRSCSPQIFCYSTKPPLHYLYTQKDRKKGNKIFFGIENEVTFSSSSIMNRNLKQLYKNFDPSILLAKSDASISGSGYEVVTQPMSLSYFHKLDLSKLLSEDQKEDRSCGMHIHVGREAFNGEVHIFKISRFLHDNVSNVDTLVGRSYTGYNEAFRDKSSKVVLDMKKSGRTPGRSCRINLTNDKTIEFRMFLGCTEEFKMRYRVEFLHALVSWTSITSLEESKDWSSFVSFVNKNTKEYPNLYKYLSTV